MAYNPLSEAEKIFILHGIQDDLRNDGRGRRDFRPMEFQVKYRIVFTKNISCEINYLLIFRFRRVSLPAQVEVLDFV
jgi:exosome complex RNA-binding protein Rrp42 (RNase PH superfamily)